jgi:CRISPR system Cascade subunit CasD
MSSDACLGLLLDGPLQSWGHASRFDRRTTALHPTRSAIIGLIAAAMGIDKYDPEEGRHLMRFAPLRVTTLAIGRRDPRGRPLPMHRLEDYHTVTGIRRASGKLDEEATVQTYRQYLLDALFGVLIEGPAELLHEIATALLNPKWGVWLGRKSCLPSCPILASGPAPRTEAWKIVLQKAGLQGTEPETQFNRVVETTPDDPSADRIDDLPVAFGAPIGSRHAPRWIRRDDPSSS